MDNDTKTSKCQRSVDLRSRSVDTLRGIEAVIELLKDDRENEVSPLSAEQHRAAIELVLANLRTVIDEIGEVRHGS